MDFITDLPSTSPPNDMIWTIVDRFSKQAYFIAFKKTLTALLVAKLFIKNVFTHHSFLKVIVIVVHDFVTIFGLHLGYKMDFSSTFHPKSNGQTEATNSAIMDLLRAYTIDHPSNSDEHLHLLQLAYDDNTLHSATTKTPFQVAYGK